MGAPLKNISFLGELGDEALGALDWLTVEFFGDCPEGTAAGALDTETGVCLTGASLR